MVALFLAFAWYGLTSGEEEVSLSKVVTLSSLLSLVLLSVLGELYTREDASTGSTRKLRGSSLGGSVNVPAIGVWNRLAG